MAFSLLTRSIGSKLSAIFVLMLVLVILAGVVGSLGAISIHNTVQYSLDTGFQVNHLVQQARLALSEVEQLESFYLTNYDRFGLANARSVVMQTVPSYIAQFENYLTRIESLLDNPDEENGAWHAEQLISEAAGYQAGIERLVDVIEERGAVESTADILDVDTHGNIGALYVAADTLEQEIGQLADHAMLLNTLHQLRLAEAAYLIRGQVSDRYRVVILISDMNELLAAISNDPSPNELTTLLDEYRLSFEAIWRLDLAVERAIQTNRGTVIAINLALGEIEDLAAQLVTETREEIFNRVIQVLTTITGAITLAFVLGSVLAAMVTRSITHPLGHITRTTQLIASGDLSKRVDISSRDEIYDLAVSFNHMTDQLQETMVGLEKEIAERRLAEDALRMTSFAVEHAADAVYWADVNAQIVDANLAACNMLGHTHQELVGMSLGDIDPLFNFDSWPDTWERIKKGDLPPFEAVHQDKGGRRIPVEILANYIMFEGQELLCSFARDITQRKQAEREIRQLNEDLERRVIERTAQLEASNQELEDFAHVVSHDLKAPLRGITQLSNWLVSDYADAFDDEGREMLDLLIKRTLRMHDLIDGILQYSRIGRTEQHIECLDLNDLVQGVIDSLAPPEAIRITIEGHLPSVMGDQIRLRQVFQNLIGNGIKFMDKPAGEVIVGCHDEGHQWHFSIKDSGPGIDPRYHEKIFQIFQTLQAQDTYEGTGIGLALVKRSVERWGGQVWVESTIGQGSTFHFTLPKE